MLLQFDTYDLKSPKQLAGLLRKAEPGPHELHVMRRDELLRIEVFLSTILEIKKDMALDKHRTLDALCANNDCVCTSPVFDQEACVLLYFVEGPGPNGGVNISILCRDTGGSRFQCDPAEFV